MFLKSLDTEQPVRAEPFDTVRPALVKGTSGAQDRPRQILMYAPFDKLRVSGMCNELKNQFEESVCKLCG